MYSVADAFVNPTWQDNYPTVNLEAISCGTPVVTYRTGGSVEAITDSTGLIVEQGDVKGLLEAVRAICQRGKDFYQNHAGNMPFRISRRKNAMPIIFVYTRN